MVKILEVSILSTMDMRIGMFMIAVLEIKAGGNNFVSFDYTAVVRYVVLHVEVEQRYTSMKVSQEDEHWL